MSLYRKGTWEKDCEERGMGMGMRARVREKERRREGREERLMI